MTILDRYILKSFLFNFVLWFFCIIGIFVIFDLFTNLDGIISTGKACGSIPKVMFTYYLFRSIPIGMMLGSILGLISAMITVAMLMRHNELIPIQAAGVSSIRIVSPLIVAVLFVAFGTAALREFVLPKYLDELVMEVDDFKEDTGSIVNATIDNETGVTIQGSRIYRSDRRIDYPNFVLHRPLVKQVTYLKAESAYYHDATADRPAGFMLTNLASIPEVIKESDLKFGDRTVILTHASSPSWIQPKDCFVLTNIPFDYLASGDAWRQYASTTSLISAARNRSLDLGHRLQANIHSRLLQPFLDMTLLFLGLPVIFFNGDRNVFKAMGISGLIILAFLVLRECCQYIGSGNNMPVLGAWLPLLVFAPIAMNQLIKLNEK